jgi:hypothetical protein
MATYYLDIVNGNNANVGTSPAAPWKTIAKLNGTTLHPGDTALFKADCLWREQLTISNSGSVGNLITFDMYGSGNAPEISGTDLLTSWSLYSGSIYQASYTNAITTLLLIEDGVVATAVGSIGGITAAGMFYADDTNHIIYYRALHSDNPSSHVMEVGGRASCVVCSNQSYITLRNLRLHGAGSGTGAGFKCVPTTTAVPSHITLDTCEVDYAYYTGIWFGNYATSPGADDSLTITNCNVHHNWQIGIHYDPADTSTRFTNVVLTQSHVHDNGNQTNALHGVYVRFCQAPVITYNEIDHNSGSINIAGGVYLASSPNSVVKYNKCHDNFKTGFHWDVNSNGFDCEWNLTWNHTHQGFMIEEHYRADGTSLLAHNLSFNDICGVLIGPGLNIHVVTGVTIVNNIFYNEFTRTVGIDTTNGGVPADNFDNTVDYNLYNVNSGGDGALMQTVAPLANYTLSQWQAFTGWDAHSKAIDPLFLRYVNDGTGNYHLQATSPAIGAGIATSSDPSTDYDGRACPVNGTRYDIGPLMWKEFWSSFMA